MYVYILYITVAIGLCSGCVLLDHSCTLPAIKHGFAGNSTI